MNYQPIIDNLPYIIVSIAALLWGASKLLTAYAAKDPAINAWDSRAASLRTISARYAEAIEWMVSSGFVKWSGAEKLAVLNRKVSEFEKLWEAGKYAEAICGLSGFWQSALSKVETAKAQALSGLNGGTSSGEDEEKDPLATAVLGESK